MANKKEVGNIQIGMSVNTSKLKAGLSQGQSLVTSFSSSIATVSHSLMAMTSGVALLGKGFNLLKFPLKLAADAETTLTSLEVLLGSVDEAAKLMEQVKKFAAATPFEMPELATATKSLLAFGFSSKEIIPQLTALGSIASGVNMSLAEAAELYGKARVQGRLFSQDVNQFTGRGIPIIQELAKQFGVTDSEVKKLVEDGKVGFDNLEKAMISLTSNGGKFTGMMERQSQTLNGMWSTAVDGVNNMLTKFGESLVKAFNLRGLLTGFINWTDNIGGLFDDLMAKMITTVNVIKPYFFGFFNSIGNRLGEFGQFWIENVKKFTGVSVVTFDGFLKTVKTTLDTVLPIAAQTFNTMVSWIQMIQTVSFKLGEGLKAVFKIASDSVGGALPSLQSFKDGVLTGLIAVEYGLRNMPQLFDLLKNKVILTSMAVRQSVGEMFLGMLPVGQWAVKQLEHMFEAFTKQTASNIAEQVAIFTTPALLLKKVADGKPFEWKSVAYQFEKMPDVITSTMEKTKTELTAQNEKITKELGDGWTKFYDLRMKQLKEIGKESINVGEKLKEGLNNKAVINAVGPAVANAVANAANKPLIKVVDPAKELSKPMFAGLAEAGSKEAYSAVVRHRFGSKDDPLRDIAKEQLVVQKQIANRLVPQKDPVINF